MKNYFGKLITCPAIILIKYPVKTADIMIKNTTKARLMNSFQYFTLIFFSIMLYLLCTFFLSQAMNTLRSKPMIIFYLKLRHNNLAKLPAYIFLGLDIRHLTVHNSSLAVIEDSSLSSIGKYQLFHLSVFPLERKN